MTVVINVYDIKGERIMNKKFTLELTNRIKHLQSNLVREELDAYILTAEESLLYFTGMSYKPEERVFL